MKHLKHIRLALIFKDFAAWIRTSCVGLNVAGYTTAKYLNEHGINTTVFPVRHNVDIVHCIDKYNETHEERLTDVVISAPWMSVWDMRNLIAHFTDINFVVLSHSNVGFLQADPYGVQLLRDYAELSKIYKNFKVGGNCLPFVEWFREAYDYNCIYLPNMYPVGDVKNKRWNNTIPLRIGAFGAIRPEKNFMTAAAAALIIHSKMKVEMEFHMSTGGENCPSTTLAAIKEMTCGIKGFKLIQHDWQTWDHFIKLISEMDLLIQLSYTESFNMITADGILVGVPSVVSPAIRWAPDKWKAPSDDAPKAAEVGIKLLTKNQRNVGVKALERNNQSNLNHWVEYLTHSSQRI